jgi:hypothetical protein
VVEIGRKCSPKGGIWVSPARERRVKWNKEVSPEGAAQVLTHTLKPGASTGLQQPWCCYTIAVALSMWRAVGRPLVKAHGTRERNAEDVVVTRRDTVEGIGQRVAFVI